MARYAIVAVPVTNLRRRPIDAALLNIHDNLQESQLLFNEPLVVTEEEAEWFAVEAMEQRQYDPVKGWHGYPGWVRKRDVVEVEKPAMCNGIVKSPFTMLLNRPSAKGERLFPLSIGTRLATAGVSKGYFKIPMQSGNAAWVARKDIREVDTMHRPGDRIGQDAAHISRLFLGVLYLWGGRSMPLPWSRGPIMGVDCSGLVNLAFLVAGLELPRDAHDQWLAATPVEIDQLRVGDLIFFSGEARPDTINHVVLFLGGEQFIEAVETGDIVRMRTFREMVGVDPGQFRKDSLTAKGRRVYFGRMEQRGLRSSDGPCSPDSIHEE